MPTQAAASPIRWDWRLNSHFVMPGLDPGIHAVAKHRCGWRGVDGRVKPGHDGIGVWLGEG